jgi:RimJ/RimL family protein N-acetyltransferase
VTIPISAHPTDLELLELRAGGTRDPIEGLRGIRLVGTSTAAAFRVGSVVPRGLGRALEAACEGTWAVSGPAVPPAIAACERLLRAEGWSVQCDADVVYLIEPAVRFESSEGIERSDRPAPEWMRGANPGNWESVEWNELLDGCLGPWAMVAHDRRIVSICHTPVPLTDCTAECGTWTEPEFRGRGHAAATTARWAELLRPSGRHLFYGADLENHSSHRVAQRLGLRLLGQQWVLREVGERVESRVHPLSRLRGRVEAR